MPKHKHDEKPHKHEHHVKHGDLDAEHLNGIVQAYNFSPKGGVEGLLLTEGDRTVQVNIPPDAWPMAAHAAAVGQTVQITASPEGHEVPDAEHPVYRLISFEPSNGADADGRRAVTRRNRESRRDRVAIQLCQARGTQRRCPR